MIQYALKCADGHSFDSWFQSAAAFDKLLAAKMVSCAICGGVSVEKAIMAPSVQARGVPAKGPDRPLATPANQIEAKLAKLRKEVEKNSDYVGMDFATEARAIHDGEAPARPIYGEAKPDEAKALLEDGVPVAPLPFRPNRKSN